MDKKPDAADLDFSLEEYIRKRKMGDEFSLLNTRNRRKEISEEALTKSLDDYIRSKVLSPKNMKATESVKSNGSKFDRRSLQDDMDSEEEDELLKDNDSDVVMKDEEDDQLADLPRFETIESVNKIRIRSQQFRLLPENIVDRPEGANRLEFLPMNNNTNLKKVHNGRIRKKKKNGSLYSSFSSLASTRASTEDIMNAGTFIEKGSFTYKFGEGNRNQRMIGIERAKFINSTPAPPVNYPHPVQSPSAAPVININFNMSDPSTSTGTIQNVLSEVLPSIQPSVSFAAKNALMALRKKREQKYNMSIQKEIASVQNRPLIFDDIGNAQRVVSCEGPGIQDICITADTTSMPPGLRFT